MKKKTKAFMMGAGAACGLWFSYHENHALDCETFVYRDKKVPKAFHGFRILQLSDLHNTRFGKGQKQLLKEIRFAHPDGIVITGDLLDVRRTQADTMRPIKELIQDIVKIAPVYYVPGNHEAASALYGMLHHYLVSKGVKVLDNRIAFLTRDDATMALVGIKDPNFYEEDSYQFETSMVQMRKVLQDEFTILLSHRPEYFPWYEACGYDLVFSGHAHGGQIQLRHRKGLYAPHQGVLPRYCDGMYRGKSSTMIVSRGLGNSKFPQRIQNHPHIITVVLSHG